MPSNSPSTEQAEDNAETSAVDEGRQALLEVLTKDLGETVAASHLEANIDLTVRIETENWAETADYLRNRQRFRFFEWLSAIDWMPSPYGRSHEAAVDLATNPQDASAEPDQSDDDAKTGTSADGICGGNARFQVFARVHNLTTQIGLTLKADLGDDLEIGSWSATYPGAAWHERETHEMFGINFAGLGDNRHLYLPSEFEGNPLRKDFPLMARLVKPWPGIVDVEPMPEVDDNTEAKTSSASDKPSAVNPEANQ